MDARWEWVYGVVGGVCVICIRLVQLGCGAALFPPARHHNQHACNQTANESSQNDQYQRCLPERAKEKVHGDGLLVVERKGEQGEKNGCFKQPQQVFQASPSLLPLILGAQAGLRGISVKTVAVFTAPR